MSVVMSSIEVLECQATISDQLLLCSDENQDLRCDSGYESVPPAVVVYDSSNNPIGDVGHNEMVAFAELKPVTPVTGHMENNEQWGMFQQQHFPDYISPSVAVYSQNQDLSILSSNCNVDPVSNNSCAAIQQNTTDNPNNFVLNTPPTCTSSQQYSFSDFGQPNAPCSGYPVAARFVNGSVFPGIEQYPPFMGIQPPNSFDDYQRYHLQMFSSQPQFFSNLPNSFVDCNSFVGAVPNFGCFAYQPFTMPMDSWINQQVVPTADGTEFSYGMNPGDPPNNCSAGTSTEAFQWTQPQLEERRGFNPFYQLSQPFASNMPVYQPATSFDGTSIAMQQENSESASFPALPTALAVDIENLLMRDEKGGYTGVVAYPEAPVEEPSIPKMTKKTGLHNVNTLTNKQKKALSSALAGDEKIRFRNRDYFAMSIRLDNVSGENASDPVTYNLTAAAAKGRGSKRAPARNALTTRFKVRELKKFLEAQQKLENNEFDIEDEDAQLNTPSFASQSKRNKITDCLPSAVCIASSANSCQLPIFADRTFSSSATSTTHAQYAQSALSIVQPLPAKKTRHLRNRSYEFQSLEIGSFFVETNPEFASRNKIRFYFGQKMLVYDFQYPYKENEMINSVSLLVMIYLPLDSIVGVCFKSREITLVLSAPPKIVSGFDRRTLPELLKEKGFGKSTIDVTKGQLNSFLHHTIVLPRAQGELIEKHLLQYNPSLHSARVRVIELENRIEFVEPPPEKKIPFPNIISVSAASLSAEAAERAKARRTLAANRRMSTDSSHVNPYRTRSKGLQEIEEETTKAVLGLSENV